MSLEITYFAEGRNRSIYGPPIQSISISDGETTDETPASAEVVRIKSLAANRYAYSPSPVAEHYIAQGDIIDIQAVPGWKITVATAA